jgi:hypothetical protein
MAAAATLRRMPRDRALDRSERETEPGQAQPDPAPARPDHKLLRSLQQTAGNHAVSQLVARQEEESAEAAPPAGLQTLQGDESTLTGARIAITDELMALVGGESEQAEPSKLKKHRGTATYGEVEGTPFGGATPSPADVKQGAIGDCYLLAALAAVAKANPSIIEGMIKDNGDGTYDVSIYEDVAWFGKDLKKKTVKVTQTFPLDEKGDPIYAKKATGLDGKPALWVMLIEKAYAQLKGGYEDIGGGGDSGEALEAITGKKVKEYDLDEYKDFQIEATLELLTSNGHAITASPRRPSAKSDLAKEQDAADIVRKHAYTLLRYEKASKTIILRNPWGFQDPKPLSPAEFRKFYATFKSVPTK